MFSNAKQSKDPSGDLRRTLVRIILTEKQVEMMRKRMNTLGDEDLKPNGSYEIEEFLNIPYMN